MKAKAHIHKMYVSACLRTNGYPKSWKGFSGVMLMVQLNRMGDFRVDIHQPDKNLQSWSFVKGRDF
jgi:hypothetical protein